MSNRENRQIKWDVNIMGYTVVIFGILFIVYIINYVYIHVIYRILISSTYIAYQLKFGTCILNCDSNCYWIVICIYTSLSQ